MNNSYRLVVSAFFLLLMVGVRVSADEIESRVDSLLQQMTLEEKIGQMNQYNGFWDATGPTPKIGDNKRKYDHLRSGLVGSILNVVGYEHVREFQKIAVEDTRLGIPLISGLDVIHGQKTLFPIPLAEAASWDLQAIETAARIAAVEASAQGINWTFAPMVDISFDARWGRVAEGAGEDPYLGSKIAIARVKGFQGNDLTANDTIAACAKHFAGYGFSEAGRDYNRVDLSMYRLYNTVLPPFKAALDAGALTFMSAFNTLNGVPATGSQFLQRDLLKNTWGFDGFVVSDWGSVGEMVAHSFAKDDRQATELAVNAGVDMDMESYAYIRYLPELIEKGLVKESTINDSVRRILRAKFKLGLFDDPFRYIDKNREQQLLNHDKHHQAARDVAKRSIVLLKNKGDILPLKKAQKDLLVIGALAADKNSVLGTWRISSEDNTAVSLLEGMREYHSDFTYNEGVKVSIGRENFAEHIKINTTDRSQMAAAVEQARSAKVVVMMLGEHGYQSGEGRSRTDLGLPGLQQELLEKIYAVNKNIVLVVTSGRPLVLKWADEHIPAIVQAWQLGSQSGNAIADVLFGEYNPSGKLPMSFPRSVGQLPLDYRVFSTGRPSPKPVVFWSHYADEENTPLYPFGFGLSYTSFDYSTPKVKKIGDKQFTVSVKVKNTGKMAGEEVVQLYLRDRFASVVRPVKELKGFEKISLEPNKSQRVTFTVTEKELGFYNERGEFLVEPGEFDVFVGGSSNVKPQATIKL